MSKRKANDIIFELDSEDIDSSSEDENQKKTPKSSKKQCLDISDSVYKAKEGINEVVDVESSGDEVVEVIENESVIHNGGKDVVTVPASQLTAEVSLNDGVVIQDSDTSSQDKDNVASNVDTLSTEESVDESNTQVAGCENKPPLMTVYFKDKRTAKKFKSKINEFILNLIKIPDENCEVSGSESDTDLELDILEESGEEQRDGLFFVDTEPVIDDDAHVIPEYSQNSMTITTSNIEESPQSTPKRRSGPICYNCQGAHIIRDCQEPRSKMRITENRKTLTTKMGRYHVDDDQKYGHLAPGRISNQLRHALDLKHNKVPNFIYRMRMLGYPPGWLEEARISHSGITMFDSKGKEITDPDEEEGEQVEPGSKDKFDIKKIIDYPGFNVPLRSSYVDEGERYGFPPMSEEDSKLNMLQMLAPNAMKAYKRKKLALFPCNFADSPAVQGEGEMDIDDGEETPEFPVLPPLPDEAPPPLPPPPPPSTNSPIIDLDTSTEQLSCEDMIVLDECNGTVDDEDVSLDELEEKKKKIMEALSDGSETSAPSTAEPVENVSTPTIDKPIESVTAVIDKQSSTSLESTPQRNTSKGQVISSSFGTPVINKSAYSALPSEDKFSKDICDIINFENLPESVGKYAKISHLLKRVKSAVDRIQES